MIHLSKQLKRTALFTMAAVGLVTFITPALLAQNTAQPTSKSFVLKDANKLDGDLGQILLATHENDRLRVVAVMKDQVDPNIIKGVRQPGVTKAKRRQLVTGMLKDKAAQTQAPILNILNNQKTLGRADRIRPLWITNVIGFEATPDTILQIAARNDVAYIHYDPPVGPEVLTGYDGGGGTGDALECGVAKMQADRVWNELGITGQGVVVCVIDTGVCITHPDIQNQIWFNPGEIPNNGIDDDNNGFIDDINGWNFENNNNNINDTFGHGSHVSGTVAGDGTQGTQAGVAPDAQIMMARFFNDFAGEQTVWDGMQYAVDNGADLTTASLGWPHNQNPDRVVWRNVCENTIAAGLVVIYAAGNEGCFNAPDNVRTPGDVPDVITIGATDCNDNIASFSSCGPITWQGIPPFDDCPFPPGCIKPTVSAPGLNTVSHNFCSGYTTMSGTSMATPHVAGTVALMLQANPNLDHFGVKQILEATAVDLGAPGKDNTYGSGRVDAYAAVLMAGGITPPCMNMTVDNLVAGQTATFTVKKNIVRGDVVSILWGTGGNDTTFINTAGYCSTFGFDVPQNPIPRIVAQGFVDQNNQFVAQKQVPAGTSGMHILIQATKKGTCPDECMSDITDTIIQ